MTQECLDLLAKSFYVPRIHRHRLRPPQWAFILHGQARKKGEEQGETQDEGRKEREIRMREGKKEGKKMRDVIPVMKSVRRNAELTSFTFYTSAVAHIINIIQQSYSSSCRQHVGGAHGAQREREEDRKQGRHSVASDVPGQHRWGMWSISSSMK